MASAASDRRIRRPVKIVVAGGFGVGKSTFVGAISDIEPLRSEAVMTQASAGIDDLSRIDKKETTTVAMDFGRVALGDELMLYLFGTPGQERFHFMWNELSRGAVGAAVLVDTRRLQESFAAVDYFEQRDLPFVVVVNTFHGKKYHELEAVRSALQVSPDVAIHYADARDKADVQLALVAVVQTALDRARARISSAPRSTTHPVASERSLDDTAAVGRSV